MAGRGRGKRSRRWGRPVNQDSRADPMVSVLGELTRVLRGLSRDQPPSPVPTTHEAGASRAQGLREFCGLNPPVFRGNDGPRAAEQWVQRLERMFEAAACAEEHKVAFATYLLEDEAELWWRAARFGRSLRGGEVSWERFSEVFLAEYSPACMRLQEERGGMEHGQAVGGIRHDTFTPHVNRCRTLEGHSRESTNDVSQSEEEKEVSTPFNRYERGKGKQEQGRQRCYFPQNSQGQCSGKALARDHRTFAVRKCYNCGKPGHLLKDCTTKDIVCRLCQRTGHLSRHCPHTPRDAGSSS